MHDCMGHPSKQVLRQAREHTKGFPTNLEFPSEDPVCPGCAEGKMPNKAFLPSTLWAKELLEFIHSDLKSFPIDSYHKYRYTIVFFDDYTSYGWVMHMRSKGAAIAKTHQFLAYIQNQYGRKI
ncbi:hypothetical protein GLOTRDRAFT_11489, partial [Gloeophyllum trabeum ATCC 11539]